MDAVRIVRIKAGNCISGRKIILALLIVTLLITSTGCQGAGQVTSSFREIKNEIGRIPDRLSQALNNLLGGLREIGAGLVQQFRDTFIGPGRK